MRVMPAGVGSCTRAGDDGDVSAGFARRCGDGKAHFARAAVGEVADRIETLARRPCRDQYVEAGQQPGIGRRLEQTLGELYRLPHAALAHLAAGLIAGGGSEDADAARNHDVHIGLGGLVGPHHPIHRRRECDGRFGGETQGGQ